MRTPTRSAFKPALGVAGLCAALTPAAHAAIADINSMVIDDRIFNDFPGTTLNITDNDFTEIEFDESNFIPDGVPDFANRHAAYFSTDNVTPYAFQNDEGFDVSFDMVLNGGVVSQTKEAGLYIETFIAGQTQFLAKSSNGEFVNFGGGFPLVSSTFDDDDGVEFGGATYTPGDTVNFRLIYTPGSGPSADPGVIEPDVRATAEFFVDGVSAGAREITNAENGIIPGSNLGVYAQFPPQGFADFGIATFTNISITPLTIAEILGDYNDNGLVEQGDLNQVLNNWGVAFDQVAATWILQRPTEGIVDQAELNVVLNRWGSDSAPDFSGSAVPEPASLALLGLGGLVLRRRGAA